MTPPLVDQIARAVLYEGYILYPYRPSVKTRQRWTFGGLYPRAYSESQEGSDAWSMQTQCIVGGSDASEVSMSTRFLHLIDRTVEQCQPTVDGGIVFEPVESLAVAERRYQPWQEAIERTVDLGAMSLGELIANPRRHIFSFPDSRTIESLEHDGKAVGRLVREQRQIEGAIEVSAERVADGVYRLTTRVDNETELSPPQENSLPTRQETGYGQERDAALMRALVSTHMVLGIRDGGFVSVTDPPEALRPFVEECKNVGCWPVLVGEPGQTDTLLASPIILSDYQQIAPESPGDLFDGCEIDEILTLRIMTLTDDEKRQAAAVDPLAAQLLARTESLARDQLMSLHGVMRPPKPATVTTTAARTMEDRHA